MTARRSSKKYSDVRIGIVGLGMGTHHLRELRQYARHYDLAAICDLNEERLMMRQREYDVPQAYTDYDEMLSEANLDAVIVAVPNVLHAPFTLKALESKLHVLCEKPMAMNLQQAKEMKAAAGKARRHLLINFNQRFSREAWALKAAIDEGELGDIYAAKCGWTRRDGIPFFGAWFTEKAKSGGGPLVDIGVHALDLTLWFLGHPKCKDVSASTYSMFGPAKGKAKNILYDVEDLAMALVKFTNGCTLFLEASWDTHIKYKECFYSELLGTDAGALRRWSDSATGEQEAFSAIYKTEHGTTVDKYLGKTAMQPPTPTQHFIDVIRGEADPIPTADDGVKVTEILEKLRDSAGKPITDIKTGGSTKKTTRKTRS